MEAMAGHEDYPLALWYGVRSGPWKQLSCNGITHSGSYFRAVVSCSGGPFQTKQNFVAVALSRWLRWKMNRLLILRSTCPRLSAPNTSEPQVKPTLQLR